MKITSLLLACTIIPGLAATTANNFLDFPGDETPPSGPGGGGSGLRPGPGFNNPPIIDTPVDEPPVVTDPMPESDVYTWTGSPTGNFFTAADWKNSLNQSPTNFTSGTAQNRNFTASNVNFFLSDGHVLSLGTGSLTLTQSFMSATGNLASPFQTGISGASQGSPSIISLAGSSLSSGFLRNLDIQAGEFTTFVPGVNLFASRADHQSGTAFSGSTINLTGFSTFLLFYLDASLGFPVGTQEVLDAYLPNIFYEGNPAELGLDPLLAEPGDNFILVPLTTTINLGTEQDPVFETYSEGYTFAPIPEPSALLLTALAIPALLRRRRA